MATRKMDVMVDDIDGTVIMEGEGRTVPVSIDGRSIELDLTNEHIAELEETFQKFFGVTDQLQQPARPRTNSSASPEALAEVRNWARANGYDVKERGRIPFSVMDAYTKAHLLRR